MLLSLERREAHELRTRFLPVEGTPGDRRVDRPCPEFARVRKDSAAALEGVTQAP